MTKNQIKYLKLLGYEDSQEDGAILQHPCISFDTTLRVDKYVWKGDKFDDILKAFSRSIMVSTMVSQASGLVRDANGFARDTRTD